MNDEAKTKEQLIAELAQFRQREASLQQRLDFLEWVINLNPHFMFVKDREGRFILANQAFARAYANTTPEMLLGQTDAQLNPNQQLVTQYRHDDLAVMDSGHDLVISEERVVKATGEVLWRETIKRPMVGPDGVAHQILGVVTDITERKQAEEALRESEERFRKLAEANFEGILIHTDGKILEANQALAQMFGYELNEMIGQPVQALIAAEWRDWTTRNMKADHENLYESVGLKKDRVTFNMEVIGKTLPYKGQVVRVSAIRDITQRKKIEQALRESEERLRQVFTSISDHIYVTEFTKSGQRINRYMSPTEALTGYPLEMLLADWSFWPSQIIHPEDREVAANQVKRFARGQSGEVAYRLIRADGRVIWVRDSVRVERDPASGSIIVYGVVSDITERKQAEEALRGTEHRLRTIINNTPLILFALDQDGIFTLSEGKGLDLIGLKPGDLVGRSIFEVYSNLPEMLGSVRQVLIQGEPHTRMIDVGSLTFEVWYEPLRDSLGQIVGAVGVALDITERKEAEETIAQALERALEASRLKSQLLAKVSHELRTPLGAILGYTELVQSGEFGPISEQQEKVIAKVMDSTHYLTKMVNELLDQAQLEVGKVRLNVSSFNLAELLAQVEANMSVLAQAKGLSLATSLAPELPVTLLGDQNRLQQILVNLASNAIKFTRNGGVQIRLYRPDVAHWAITVTDTGPGIPEEAQAYIFEPFQQVDGSVTREHVGTGLGLSIVKQLVNLMEGEITLESELGQGSAFTVLLPLQTVEEKIYE